jgi:vacuolar-type H+-ATPase subunit F/Vma7
MSKTPVSRRGAFATASGRLTRALFATSLVFGLAISHASMSGVARAEASAPASVPAIRTAGTPTPPTPPTTLAEIEACASENLPEAAGVIGFSVDAVDRTGGVTASRAELRWRKPEAEQTQILLVVSEPAKTAGTALLIIDRHEDKPEFFVRLPEMRKVKKVRSRRLRGPVLGTDFSYEDLKRLREPLGETKLELLGTEDVEGHPAWMLETIPTKQDDSEYSRVLTYVDHATCLPVRIDLFEIGVDGVHRLRKRLDAPRAEIRSVSGVGAVIFPHQFVMEDLRRETQTIVRVERFQAIADLPAEQFTRAALQESVPPQPAAPNR